MSSIVDGNRCFLNEVQLNRLKLLILKEQVAFSDDLFKMVSPAGLGTPAQNFAGPPHVVRFKLRISLSDLLSSTLVFANYPLRTKILVLAMTNAPQQKNPPFQVDFLLAGRKRNM